ncbi:MAG: 50S ribosomal protein L29 [Chloroflexota bacterium]
MAELAQARRRLYDLRFRLATRQLRTTARSRRRRRYVARLLTVQTERELG